MYILNSIFTTLFETPAFNKDVMSLFAEETDKIKNEKRKRKKQKTNNKII